MKILKLLSFSLFFFAINANASLINNLKHLQRAYPNEIKSVSKETIYWEDGTKMVVNNKFAKQLEDSKYPRGYVTPDQIMQTKADPGRIRYEPFFEKMYGDSKLAVFKQTKVIYWMPGIFGKKYPLEVTTVNDVDKKLEQVSAELERLPPSYYKYVDHPEGAFVWRKIADEKYRSPHSYGIALDINKKYSNYWEWDLTDAHLPVKESTPLTYHNQIPWRIVKIFEKNGFIWGGKWYHYDTMHFEYRPELLPVKR